MKLGKNVNVFDLDFHESSKLTRKKNSAILSNALCAAWTVEVLSI